MSVVGGQSYKKQLDYKEMETAKYVKLISNFHQHNSSLFQLQEHHPHSQTVHLNNQQILELSNSTL